LDCLFREALRIASRAADPSTGEANPIEAVNGLIRAVWPQWSFAAGWDQLPGPNAVGSLDLQTGNFLPNDAVAKAVLLLVWRVIPKPVKSRAEMDNLISDLRRKFMQDNHLHEASEAVQRGYADHFPGSMEAFNQRAREVWNSQGSRARKLGFTDELEYAYHLVAQILDDEGRGKDIHGGWLADASEDELEQAERLFKELPQDHPLRFVRGDGHFLSTGDRREQIEFLKNWFKEHPAKPKPASTQAPTVTAASAATGADADILMQRMMTQGGPLGNYLRLIVPTYVDPKSGRLKAGYRAFKKQRNGSWTEIGDVDSIVPSGTVIGIRETAAFVAAAATPAARQGTGETAGSAPRTLLSRKGAAFRYIVPWAMTARQALNGLRSISDDADLKGWLETVIQDEAIGAEDYFTVDVISTVGGISSFERLFDLQQALKPGMILQIKIQDFGRIPLPVVRRINALTARDECREALRQAYRFEAGYDSVLETFEFYRMDRVKAEAAVREVLASHFRPRRLSREARWKLAPFLSEAVRLLPEEYGWNGAKCAVPQVVEILEQAALDELDHTKAVARLTVLGMHGREAAHLLSVIGVALLRVAPAADAGSLVAQASNDLDGIVRDIEPNVKIDTNRGNVLNRLHHVQRALRLLNGTVVTAEWQRDLGSSWDVLQEAIGYAEGNQRFLGEERIEALHDLATLLRQALAQVNLELSPPPAPALDVPTLIARARSALDRIRDNSDGFPQRENAGLVGLLDLASRSLEDAAGCHANEMIWFMELARDKLLDIVVVAGYADKASPVAAGDLANLSDALQRTQQALKALGATAPEGIARGPARTVSLLRSTEAEISRLMHQTASPAPDLEESLRLAQAQVIRARPTDPGRTVRHMIIEKAIDQLREAQRMCGIRLAVLAAGIQDVNLQLSAAWHELYAEMPSARAEHTWSRERLNLLFRRALQIAEVVAQAVRQSGGTADPVKDVNGWIQAVWPGWFPDAVPSQNSVPNALGRLDPETAGFMPDLVVTKAIWGMLVYVIPKTADPEERAARIAELKRDFPQDNDLHEAVEAVQGRYAENFPEAMADFDRVARNAWADPDLRPQVLGYKSEREYAFHLVAQLLDDEGRGKDVLGGWLSDASQHELTWARMLFAVLPQNHPLRFVYGDGQFLRTGDRARQIDFLRGWYKAHPPRQRTAAPAPGVMGIESRPRPGSLRIDLRSIGGRLPPGAVVESEPNVPSILLSKEREVVRFIVPWAMNARQALAGLRSLNPEAALTEWLGAVIKADGLGDADEFAVSLRSGDASGASQPLRNLEHALKPGDILELTHQRRITKIDAESQPPAEEAATLKGRLLREMERIMARIENEIPITTGKGSMRRPLNVGRSQLERLYALATPAGVQDLVRVADGIQESIEIGDAHELLDKDLGGQMDALLGLAKQTILAAKAEVAHPKAADGQPRGPDRAAEMRARKRGGSPEASFHRRVAHARPIVDSPVWNTREELLVEQVPQAGTGFVFRVKTAAFGDRVHETIRQLLPEDQPFVESAAAQGVISDPIIAALAEVEKALGVRHGNEWVSHYMSGAQSGLHQARSERGPARMGTVAMVRDYLQQAQCHIRQRNIIGIVDFVANALRALEPLAADQPIGTIDQAMETVVGLRADYETAAGVISRELRNASFDLSYTRNPQQACPTLRSARESLVAATDDVASVLPDDHRLQRLLEFIDKGLIEEAFDLVNNVAVDVRVRLGGQPVEGILGNLGIAMGALDHAEGTEGLRKGLTHINKALALNFARGDGPVLNADELQRLRQAAVAVENLLTQPEPSARTEHTWSPERLDRLFKETLRLAGRAARNDVLDLIRIVWPGWNEGDASGSPKALGGWLPDSREIVTYDNIMKALLNLVFMVVEKPKSDPKRPPAQHKNDLLDFTKRLWQGLRQDTLLHEYAEAVQRLYAEIHPEELAMFRLWASRLRLSEKDAYHAVAQYLEDYGRDKIFGGWLLDAGKDQRQQGMELFDKLPKDHPLRGIIQGAMFDPETGDRSRQIDFLAGWLMAAQKPKLTRDPRHAVEALIADLSPLIESRAGSGVRHAIDKLHQYPAEGEAMLPLVEAAHFLQAELELKGNDRTFKDYPRLSGLKGSLGKIIESIFPRAIPPEVCAHVRQALEDVHRVYQLYARLNADQEFPPLPAALAEASALLMEIHHVEPGRWPEQLAAAKKAVDKAVDLKRSARRFYGSSIPEDSETRCINRAQAQLTQARDKLPAVLSGAQAASGPVKRLTSDDAAVYIFQVTDTTASGDAILKAICAGLLEGDLLRVWIEGELARDGELVSDDQFEITVQPPVRDALRFHPSWQMLSGDQLIFRQKVPIASGGTVDLGKEADLKRLRQEARKIYSQLGTVELGSRNSDFDLMYKHLRAFTEGEPLKRLESAASLAESWNGWANTYLIPISLARVQQITAAIQLLAESARGMDVAPPQDAPNRNPNRRSRATAGSA